MSFGGTYRHQIDEKKRARIPAKLREKLGERYCVTKGTDGCLFVYTTEYFDTVFAPRLEALPMSDPAARKLQRFFLGNRYDIEEDKQGRFVIPEELFGYAGISKNIVTQGVGDRIEMWAEERFDGSETLEDFDSALEALNKYNF